MSDLYADCAAALRAMLPRLAEPDQQVVAAAALALDHAADHECDRDLPTAVGPGNVRDLMPSGPVRYVREK